MGKTIGETLREGRLRQRLSIAECAKRTHISSHYLEALEEERWEDLPSESHRIGFLRLYAVFLGVFSNEMLQVYREAKQGPPAETPADSRKVTLPRSPEKSTSRWNTITWQRLSLWLILVLAASWGLYHGLRHYQSSPRVDLSWLKFRPRSSPRLVAPKRDALVQRIRATAAADSWLRVVDNHQLVFEGILPAGAVKEWTGPGPFRIKVGNMDALSITWNDQPVDIKALSRGPVADLRLPPAAEPEKS